MISHEDEDFFRDFEIRDEQNFLDFHYAIQDELGYDKGQIASFFISNEEWEKKTEITLFDMTDPDDGTSEAVTMENTPLSQYVVANKQHLLYVFDFFSERAMFLELVDVREDNTAKSFPVCIQRRGEPPQQIVLDDSGAISLDDLEGFDDLGDENNDDDYRDDSINDLDDLPWE